MPTLNDNRWKWDGEYGWGDDGHEWSAPWGSAPEQWIGTIYRRIFSVLPTESILEIAPGYGRWTPFLLQNCKQYVGIDISERAVTHCRTVFGSAAQKPKFFLGDGMTFEGVPDASVSFVFSFDSLVHVELDCIASYAAEIGRVLKPGGYAFIHHSNMAEYSQANNIKVDNVGWRGTSVSAENAQEQFTKAGLASVAHEKIQWVFGSSFCDCFSLVQKFNRGDTEKASRYPIFYNENFGFEVQISKFLHGLYVANLLRES